MTFRFTPFGEEKEFPEVEKMDVDEKFIQKMAKIADAQSTYKGTAEELEAAVKQIIVSHDCMRIDGSKGRVSYSESTPKQKFNTTLLKTEEPELYDYYSEVKEEFDSIKTAAYPSRKTSKSLGMDELYSDLRGLNYSKENVPFEIDR